MSGMKKNDLPIICGGWNGTHQSRCYFLDKNLWKSTFEMTKPTAGGSFVQSPFGIKSHQLVSIGGVFANYDRSKNVEVLTDKGWERQPYELPVGLYGLCTVLVNLTSLMVLGGQTGQAALNNTYILNLESQSWVSGPTLKNKRMSHSCSKFRKNKTNPSSFSVIVVGGEGTYDSNFLSSVEIFDYEANLWRDGPDLPITITRAAMIEDPLGGVILIGGRSSTNSNLDSLYRLAHAGEDAHWVKLPQTLEVGRSFLTAILVPDNIANCTFF
jgi:N-acetylneuraminic acid mutarotase